MENLKEAPKTGEKLKKFTKDDLKNILGGLSNTNTNSTDVGITNNTAQQTAVSDNLT